MAKLTAYHLPLAPDAVPPWTSFLHEDRVLERVVTLQLGYDCRQGCTPTCPHKSKSGGRYGLEGDLYRLHARLDEVALTLRCPTRFVGGLVASSIGNPFWPDCVEICTAFPTRRAELRNLEPSSRCQLQPKGAHYMFMLSTGLAAQIWAEHERQFRKLFIPHPHLVLGMLAQDVEPLWQGLGRMLLTSYADARAQQRALPPLCPHCKGEGFLT